MAQTPGGKDLKNPGEVHLRLLKKKMAKSFCSGVSSVLQVLVGNYSSAIQRLDPEVGRTEGAVDVFRDDLSRLIDEVSGSSSEQKDQRRLK